MYEAKQRKEKVSRRIGGNGGRLKFNGMRTLNILHREYQLKTQMKRQTTSTEEIKKLNSEQKKLRTSLRIFTNFEDAMKDEQTLNEWNLFISEKEKQVANEASKITSFNAHTGTISHKLAVRTAGIREFGKEDAHKHELMDAKVAWISEQKRQFLNNIKHENKETYKKIDAITQL